MINTISNSFPLLTFSHKYLFIVFNKQSIDSFDSNVKSFNQNPKSKEQQQRFFLDSVGSPYGGNRLFSTLLLEYYPSPSNNDERNE